MEGKQIPSKSGRRSARIAFGVMLEHGMEEEEGKLGELWRVGLCCQPEGCWVPAIGDSKERGGERLAGHALGRQLGRVRGKGGVGPRGEGRAWMGRLLRQRWLSPFFSSFLFRNLFPIKLLSIDK